MATHFQILLQAEQVRENFRRYGGWDYADLSIAVEELTSKCGSVLKTKQEVYSFLFQEPLNWDSTLPAANEHLDGFAPIPSFSALAEDVQASWVKLVSDCCPEVAEPERIKAAEKLYVINHGLLPG